jgi:hypothetical protein
MNAKHPQPKKIKLPPLVDRSEQYDTLSFDNETLPDVKTFWRTYPVENDENHNQNDSQSIQQLESDSTD